MCVHVQVHVHVFEKCYFFTASLSVSLIFTNYINPVQYLN